MSQDGGNVDSTMKSPTPAPDDLLQLLQDVKEHPHQTAKWRQVVAMAESSGETEKIREVYEALLNVFPNTAAAQIAYINHYLSNTNTFQHAEALFSRCLKGAPSVELFRFYLTYIRRIHADPTRKDPAKRDIIRKAYEYALNGPHGIGQDKDAGDIWADYINFLGEGEATTAWDQQHKTDALRKAYHRAVQIPLDNVDRLWQDLESFEVKLNKITAKKFMSDLSEGHMQARSTLRVLERHVRDLYPPAVGVKGELFLPELPQFTAEDRQLVGKWKAYLKWEESNPLVYDDKMFVGRVAMVYRKAVVRMRYYSEIWFMAYHWARSKGRTEDAMTILRQGREANPLSHLLTFAYVEALELEGSERYGEVRDVFDGFLDALRQDLEATAIAAESKPEDALEEKEKEVDDELTEKKREYGLVYIMYMRFVRRTDNVQAARVVFKKARLDRWVGWHVYEAAAMLEYHCTSDKAVPTKIFAMAYDKFREEKDVDFVTRYLTYLFSINDEQNARLVFETATKQIPPEKARPIWERWARYEYQYGDLESSLKLEKRMGEVYPNDQPIKRFAQRHIYGGTDAIASRDLGVAVARKANSGGKQDTAVTPTSVVPPPPPPNGKRPEKRAASPDGGYAARKREDKRPRGASRERRRYSPPREKERERPVRRDVKVKDERENDQEKVVVLPHVLHWFHSQLPPAGGFDGPVFRTEDLMNIFRNAVIPSTAPVKEPLAPVQPPQPVAVPQSYGGGGGYGAYGSRPRSPAVSDRGGGGGYGPRGGGGGRPPPDYSPYTGPGTQRGRRY